MNTRFLQILSCLSFIYVRCCLTLVPGKYFDRIFIMVFENQGWNDVNKNPDFMNLANKGLLLSQYTACTHPSQGNYICLVAGDNLGITDDDKHDLPQNHIGDLLDVKNINWRAYQEDYPNKCFTDDRRPYMRKHNPFISFTNVNTNESRCANIVDESQLDIDLQSPSTMPQFMFYTPNMNNDGHDTSLEYLTEYLTKFLNERLDKFPENTLIVITFDEADPPGEPDYDPNHIVTFLLGSMITQGTEDRDIYTHASITRLVEENWDLGTLGRKDSTANIMFPIKSLKFLS
jgi:hypothetical protein